MCLLSKAQFLHRLTISVVLDVGNVEVAEGQTEEDALRDQEKTEISLTLSNKFEVPDDDDSDLRALFVR